MTIEEELSVQVGLERQLRDSLSVRDAELAAASAEAARRQLAERRREATGGADGKTALSVDSDFFERIERAKRLSETAN
jgi:hypothetical protein